MMQRQVLIFLICTVLVCSGCSGKLTSSEDNFLSTGDINGHDTGRSNARLPGSYGPLLNNDETMQQVEKYFQSDIYLGETGSFSDSEIQIVRNRFLASALVFGCDFEVLKAFVASDWRPLVIVKSSPRSRNILAMLGYDDLSDELTLFDPMKSAQSKMSYSEFRGQWEDPKNMCVLIFSQYVGAEKIRRTLKKYLPEEQVESITIMTSSKV